MGMTEAPLEEWACDEAEKAGWLVRKLGWKGRRRAPDRFFAKEGRVVLIEFKRPGKGAETGQKSEVRRLQEAGVEAHVVDNPLAALRILGVPYGRP